MAQSRTDFIAGKMNKTVDERLVPPGEYVDAAIDKKVKERAAAMNPTS